MKRGPRRHEGPAAIPRPPAIAIRGIEYGTFRGAPSLNPWLSGRRPLLLVTLDIDWHPVDPRARILEVERRLLALSPRFGRHACRGPAAYHVFRKHTPAAGDPLPFEGSPALAHLIEHAMLEFHCDITGSTRCSGVTAAYRRPAGRYDVMVECDSPWAGRCALGLALDFVSGPSGRGEAPAAQRELLETARLAFLRYDGALTPPVVARAFRWPEAKAGRALASLRDLGCLREMRPPMNLSGLPAYKLRG